MKVAILSHGVIDQSLLGGPGRVASRHASALAERGHLVRVVTTDLVRKGQRSPAPLHSFPEDGPVSVECLPAYTLRRWPGAVGPMIVPGLRAAVRDAVRWADVVHAHEWPSPLTQAARRFCRGLRRPLFVQPHGTVVARRGVRGTLHRGYNAVHRVRDDEVFVVLSDEEAADVRSVLNCTPTIHIVANPTPRCTMIEGSPEVRARRAAWAFPPASTVLLYAHRITPNKGLDLAIAAMTDLPPSFCLVVTGEDATFPSFTNHCRRLVDDLGLHARVRFLGPFHSTEVDELILAADVFLLPARFDTFPLMVLHAMACGRPVVLTRTCQCARSVGECAIVCDPDPGSIAAAARGLSADSTSAFAESGRQLIASHYSAEAVAASLEAIYAGRNNDASMEVRNVVPEH